MSSFSSQPNGDDVDRGRSNTAVVLEEWNGSSSAKLSRTAVISSSSASSSSLTIRRSGNRFGHLWRRVLEAFVPEGFPSSVTSDYATFQLWDLLQGLSTYIRTMLSTQALLSAIGVGEKSATVIGATFQWFLRDLTGMLGGILFTFYQGSNLDSNAKRWRLVADFMNDLGMLMDLVSPLYPSAFIFIVCLGSLSRSFTGVASGATRAALTQHFALQNNAADISAKEGSQETAATMIGMALGMVLAHISIGHPLFIWICFLFLTMFHIYANYKAVQCLALTSMNMERSSIILKHFVETGEVLLTSHVSKMEHILPSWFILSGPRSSKSLESRIKLGVRVSSLEKEELVILLREAESRPDKDYILVEREGVIGIVVHKSATAADILRSFFHALVMAHKMDNAWDPAECEKWMDQHYEVLLQKDLEGPRSILPIHSSFDQDCINDSYQRDILGLIGFSLFLMKNFEDARELNRNVVIDLVEIIGMENRAPSITFDHLACELAKDRLIG